MSFTQLEELAFIHHQGAGKMHPYTCGKDSNHGSLFLSNDVFGRGQFLQCPQRCGYEQNWIGEEMVTYFVFLVEEAFKERDANGRIH